MDQEEELAMRAKVHAELEELVKEINANAPRFATLEEANEYMLSSRKARQQRVAAIWEKYYDRVNHKAK